MFSVGQNLSIVKQYIMISIQTTNKIWTPVLYNAKCKKQPSYHCQSNQSIISPVIRVASQTAKRFPSAEQSQRTSSSSDSTHSGAISSEDAVCSRLRQSECRKIKPPEDVYCSSRRNVAQKLHIVVLTPAVKASKSFFIAMIVNVHIKQSVSVVK